MKPTLLILTVAASFFFQSSIIGNFPASSWKTHTGLIDSLKQSQYRALNEIKNDSLKGKYADIVDHKWKGSDTIAIELLAKEIINLQTTSACSDSVLVIGIFNSGEVAHHMYYVCDLKTTKLIYISIGPDHTLNKNVKENYAGSSCDAIIKKYFSKSPHECSLLQFTSYDCFFIDGSLVTSCLCLGQDGEDLGQVEKIRINQPLSPK